MTYQQSGRRRFLAHGLVVLCGLLLLLGVLSFGPSVARAIARCSGSTTLQTCTFSGLAVAAASNAELNGNDPNILTIWQFDHGSVNPGASARVTDAASNNHAEQTGINSISPSVASQNGSRGPTAVTLEKFEATNALEPNAVALLIGALALLGVMVLGGLGWTVLRRL